MSKTKKKAPTGPKMGSGLSSRDKLTAAIGAVNKKYGEGTIAKAGTVSFSHKRRLSTGIVALDMETGGGIPKGRIAMVVGDEAAGKTTLCIRLAAKAQHTCRACMGLFEYDTVTDPSTGETEQTVTVPCTCGKNEPHVVAYFDAEGTFDPDWAKLHGMDVANTLLIQPEYAQQGVDTAAALIRTGELDLLVIDSIAMLTPRREVEESAEAGQRPDLALIVNRAMRVFQSALNSLGMNNPNKPAIVQVNQFREKVGVMYGDPTTWPGGRGQNFAASILIVMRGGKKVDAKGVVGGVEKKKLGIELNFSVEKNKTFTPYRKGSFRLYNDDAPALGIVKGTVDNFAQMMSYATSLGVIQQSGAWYDLQPTFGAEFANPDSKKGNFQGLDSVVAYLKAHPVKQKAVEDRILASVQGMAANVAAVQDAVDDALTTETEGDE